MNGSKDTGSSRESVTATASPLPLLAEPSAAFTPGPWSSHSTVTTDGVTAHVVMGNERDGCWWSDVAHAFEAADARLIAAAPAMIDALRQWAHAEAIGDAEELANARQSRDAAIAKTEGRQ
jgi:hypothetical protein